MPEFNARKLLQKARKSPQEFVGVDLDPTGVRCVRLKKMGDEIAVVAADILPAVAWGEDERPLAPLSLPKALLARYAVVCLPGEGSHIKLLNLPGQLDANSEATIKGHMGIEEKEGEQGPPVRLGYRIISQGHGRETKLLTVAVPETKAQVACALFPVGIPAPFSIELAGTAVLTAFLNGPGKAAKNEALGVIEYGARDTIVAFFNKQELVLIRKFDFGGFSVLDKIQQRLGVDHETAQGIISDGSFDISHMVKEVADPFIKQMVISKLHVERRENCRLSRIFVPGGGVMAADFVNEIKTALSVDVAPWNPWDGLKVLPGAVTAAAEGQASKFAAAVGACLGTLEEAAKPAA